MAKVRQVNTFFWDDPYIEDLCPLGKLLFIYLITTPLTNIAGSFEITVKKMHDHTGIEKTEILDLLKRFEADKKCIYRGHWMLICNTIEHQHWQTHKTIKEGIVNIVSESPDWVKDRLGVAYEWLSHLNLNPNSTSISKEVAANAADSPTKRDQIPVQERIWKDGVDLLIRSDMTNNAARSFLGRMSKDFSEEALATAIAVAQVKNAADPKAYIVATLRKPKAPDMSVGKYDPDRADIAPELCTYCKDEFCISNHREELLQEQSA